VRGSETSPEARAFGQPNKSIVRHFLLSRKPAGWQRCQAGNAERYSAEATTGKKEILRPSHSPSVKREIPPVIRRRQWGPPGIRMRGGGTPVERPNQPPSDDSLTLRVVENKYE